MSMHKCSAKAELWARISQDHELHCIYLAQNFLMKIEIWILMHPLRIHSLHNAYCLQYFFFRQLMIKHRS